MKTTRTRYDTTDLIDEADELTYAARVRAKNAGIVDRGRPRIGWIFIGLIVLTVCDIAWMANGGSW